MSVFLRQLCQESLRTFSQFQYLHRRHLHQVFVKSTLKRILPEEKLHFKLESCTCGQIEAFLFKTEHFFGIEMRVFRSSRNFDVFSHFSVSIFHRVCFPTLRGTKFFFLHPFLQLSPKLKNSRFCTILVLLLDFLQNLSILVIFDIDNVLDDLDHTVRCGNIHLHHVGPVQF